MANPFVRGLAASADGTALSGTRQRRHTVLNLAIRAAALIQGWSERRRQRESLNNLAELNPHLLNDIGLTRDDALREAAKPFWR